MFLATPRACRSMDGLPFLSLACCSTLGGIDGLYFEPRERPKHSARSWRHRMRQQARGRAPLARLQLDFSAYRPARRVYCTSNSKVATGLPSINTRIT